MAKKVALPWYLFFILVMSTVTPHNSHAARIEKTFNVVIDPGHGGADSGAVRGHLRESDIALDVATKVAALIRKDPHLSVTLTRESDAGAFVGPFASRKKR